MGYRRDPRPRVEGRPKVVLRRETANDQKVKRWKLNREVQTGDPTFDELVYVESDAPDKHLQTVLQSPETRHTIKTLFELGYRPIGINTEGNRRRKFEER